MVKRVSHGSAYGSSRQQGHLCVGQLWSWAFRGLHLGGGWWLWSGVGVQGTPGAALAGEGDVSPFLPPSLQHLTHMAKFLRNSNIKEELVEMYKFKLI